MKVLPHLKHVSPKLSNIRIASPCPADWDKMSGDDRVRQCAECNLNIYNFSAMTEAKVERLLGERKGRLCARFYRRADGTILTQDCPIGWRTVVRRVSRVAGAALSAVMSLGSAFAQNTPNKPPQSSGVLHAKSGAIVIRAKDPTGALIPNAQIRLFSSSGDQIRTGITNRRGELRMNGIYSGSYVVRVSIRGFQDDVVNVTIKTGVVKNLPLKLSLGTRTDIVEVTTVLGVIDVVQTPAKTEIDLVPYHSFPLDNRLNQLVAGVQSAPDSSRAKY